jgi:hypothetical protein
MGVTNFSQVNPEYTTGTAASGAVTVNSQSGLITSESLTTATQGIYTLTVTNNRIGTNSSLSIDTYLGTATNGSPVISSIAVTAGQAVITVQNLAGASLNGTIVFPFWVLNPLGK